MRVHTRLPRLLCGPLLGVTLALAPASVGLAQTDLPFTRAEIDAAREAFVEGDYSVIQSIAIPAAEAGDASAQNLVAIAYGYGYGLPQSDRLAHEWFTRAAEQGLARAQVNLALRIIDDDKATDADLADALRHAQAAADQGFPRAFSVLTDIYRRGIGVAADPAQAARYARLGADMGNPRSLYEYAYMLYTGEGVETDAEAARAMFEQAGEAGVSDGYFYLAEMQAAGRGGPANLDAALSSYTKSVSFGSEEAAFMAAQLIHDNADHFPHQMTGLTLCYLALRTSTDAALSGVMLYCADWAADFTEAQNATARDTAASYDLGAFDGRPLVAFDPPD